MLISADITGGQIVSASEEPRFYDDIRCLVAEAAPIGAHVRVYVRTVSGSWAEAQRAGFARTGKTHTPMGSGIVAFDTVDAARAAASATLAMTWDDLIAVVNSEARR